MKKFTKNQELAIYDNSHNILISAGAGSGKTTVLTTRVINKLKNNVKIDQLLILTFTLSAATEMKTRIKEELKNKEELKEELQKIEIADIMTFDSFIINLVKQYSYELNLTQNLKIGEQSELNYLLKLAINEEFNKIYDLYDNLKDSTEKERQKPKYYDLLTNYFVFNDEKLKANIMTLYFQYETTLQPFEKPLTKERIVLLFRDYENYIFQFVKKIKKIVKQILQIQWAPKAANILKKYFNLAEFLTTITTYNQIIDLLNYKFPSKTTLQMEDVETFKTLQEELKIQKDILKKVYLPQTKENLIFQVEELQVVTKDLEYLLSNIEKNYFKKKIENNIFSFLDMNKFALKLLENKKIQQEVKEKYAEILIDEYQDTNDFQNALINLISSDNLYLVGDIKQSIYGFRNANPENFILLQQQFFQNEKAQVISLLDNFRSRQEVLNSVNKIFTTLMHPQFSDIDYQENHALFYGNRVYDLKKENQNYYMNFLNYDKNLKKNLKEINLDHNYLEPLIIANDIQNKIKNKFQINENGELRDCRYEDFVILTKYKTHYPSYNKVFTSLGIPIDIQLEDNLNATENYELRVLISILNLIINPQNNLALISLLRSFLIDLDDQIIHDYISNQKEHPIITENLAKIKKIKKQNILSLEYLIDEIFEEFKIVQKIVQLGNLNNVNNRLIYIQKLAISATKQGKNLKEFIDYLEDTQTNQEQKMEVELEKEISNSVKVMTIHKSKGLEYMIVYIAGLQADISKTEKDLIKYHQNYGFILPNIKNYLKEKTFLENYLNLQRRNEVINENIRLLYVAMTRAKEKIYFISEQIDDLQKIKYRNKEHIIKLNHLLKYFENYNLDKEHIININDLESLLEIDFEKLQQHKKIKQENIINHNDEKKIYKEINITGDLIQANKFSKTVENILSNQEQEAIELGIKLHDFLEDLAIDKLLTEDYYEEIIQANPHQYYQQAINNLRAVLKNILIVNYYTEYEFNFLENEQNNNGIIDLLIESEKYIYIIDYKLKNINNKEYQNQLNGYRNIMKNYFQKPIKCILVSLTTENTLEF